MKVFVTGVNGQLGHDVMNRLAQAGHTAVGTDITPAYAGALDGTAVTALPYVQLDITDEAAVTKTITELHPDAIVHCAAWTAVDAAEDPNNFQKVIAINEGGTRNIAEACKAVGAKLLYLSTDYVFNGQGEAPWEPDCKDYAPLNIYGKSKLAGEMFVRELAPKHMVVRSSWIYGNTKNNFVSYILEELLTEDTIFVPVDQVSTPTSAVELAKFIVKLVNSSEYGIYHASCEGMCSRYEFAKEIVRLSGKNVNIEPLTAGENPSVVNRPRYTLLDNFMMRVSGIYEMPDWKEALAAFMAGKESE